MCRQWISSPCGEQTKTKQNTKHTKTQHIY